MYAFAALGLLPLVGTWFSVKMVVRTGLLLAFGRGEVRVDQEMLIASDRFGPFSWTRTIPRNLIDRYEIQGFKDDPDADSDMDHTDGVTRISLGQGWEDSRVLTVALAKTRGAPGPATKLERTLRKKAWRRTVAFGYPESVLRDLAELLGAEVVDATTTRSAKDRALRERLHDGSKTPLVTIDDESSYHTDDPPADSDAVLDRTPDGLTITFPPRGWKGAKGTAGFTVMWLGFIAIWTGASLIPVVKHIANGGAFLQADWLFVLFSIPFWLVGIFMGRYAQSLAKRKAILDVIGDALIITEERLRGPRSVTLTADQIRSIKIGKTGTEVNDRPIKELQIRLRSKVSKEEAKELPGSIRDGRKVIGILAERENDVIRWAAKTVNTALKAASDAEAEN